MQYGLFGSVSNVICSKHSPSTTLMSEAPNSDLEIGLVTCSGPLCYQL
jgi:hypothetical protein